MSYELLDMSPAEATRASLPWRDGLPAWPLEASDPAPDRCVAIARGASIVARASVWTETTAGYRGLAAIYFGHVAASSSETLQALLARVGATSWCPGAAWLLGPIDGSTWHRYRVVVDHGEEPPFPLEPTNPPWWGGALESAGFEPVERYWSASRDLTREPPDSPPPAPPGVRIRSLDVACLEAELDAIYELAVQAFAANPLYTPISRAGFRQMYLPIASHLDPECCLVAEDEEQCPIAVMFSLPADGARLVLKTLAVSDRFRGRGLGSHLLGEIAWRGHRRGFTHLVFALMHEDNASSRIVGKLARRCRRYALYGRLIEP